MKFRVALLCITLFGLPGCSADAVREAVPFATLVLGPGQGYVGGGTAAREAEEDEGRSSSPQAGRGVASSATIPAPASASTKAQPHESQPVQTIRRTVIVGAGP